jgi:hypothetical protein
MDDATVRDQRNTLGLYQMWTPADHGLIEWNYDHMIAASNSQPVSGTLYLMKIIPQIGGVMTNVALRVNVSGSSFTAATTATITGAANNGSGLIRITATAHGFSTNDVVTISGVTGTTEANGAWVITSIDANHFDLVASTFTNAYVSGGTAVRSANLCAIFDSSGVFLGATGDQVSVWNSSGNKVMPLAKAITLTAGQGYFIALLCLSSSAPQIARNITGTQLSMGQTGSSMRFAINGTSLTKMPNSLNYASNVAAGAFGFWMGLS